MTDRSPGSGRASRHAHLLAEAGYLHDAFDALSRIADAAPDSPRAAAQRVALLEQVGLGDVGAQLERD